MWLSLVGDVKGSQQVVGREHKRVFFNQKRIVFLCIASWIVSQLSPSFEPLLQVLVYVLHYWRQQFIGERTRILDAWITILLG